jgi:hypothetical protein
VAWAGPEADGEPAAPLAAGLVAGVLVPWVLVPWVPVPWVPVAWVPGEADPAAPLAPPAEVPLAELSLAEAAGDVGWLAGFGPSLPQAATTTVAPSGSALPPIPLVSTK